MVVQYVADLKRDVHMLFWDLCVFLSSLSLIEAFWQGAVNPWESLYSMEEGRVFKVS